MIFPLTQLSLINDAVVAPEVIEQSGATTASDIWFKTYLPHVFEILNSCLICRSVGCVVIELLEGKPPYHFLDPMPALFRIVQDDCPPIPEGASPVGAAEHSLIVPH